MVWPFSGAGSLICGAASALLIGATLVGRPAILTAMDDVRSLAATLHRTIGDARVVNALLAVPRERFVPAQDRARAYANVALPIDCGQTISQPVIVARMLELLELTAADRVLDVGTGSGYHAAVLARLVREVWSVERHGALVATAQRTLAELGISNVVCVHGDGLRGLPAQAPFDAINIAAAGPRIPVVLERQLGLGGRLVAPVGIVRQHLVRVRHASAGLSRERLDPVRFVPLVGGARS
ncbi:MAG: protein-L-isoaspartate O-methyltransferase [Candidatus Dormibacteria bacterium]